jgi:hypothetical protein
VPFPIPGPIRLTLNRYIETDAPVVTGNFEFVYPNVYVVVRTAGPDGQPTHTVTSIQPTGTPAQESRQVRRITDPRRFLSRTASQHASNTTDHMGPWNTGLAYEEDPISLWGTTECIHPFMTMKPVFNRSAALSDAGFTGPGGSFSGTQFDPLAYWEIFKSEHVEFTMYSEYKDCAEEHRTSDWSTKFEVAVCNCEVVRTDADYAKLPDVDCSVSKFKWSYDGYDAQTVQQVIKAALNVSESCAFDDELGAPGKIPRNLELVAETMLPPIQPPGWMSSGEDKHGGPAAPKPGEGAPSPSGAAPNLADWVPQPTGSTAKQAGPVIAEAPLGTASATFIHDGKSGLNTIVQGQSTTVFVG